MEDLCRLQAFNPAELALKWEREGSITLVMPYTWKNTSQNWKSKPIGVNGGAKINALPEQIQSDSKHL